MTCSATVPTTATVGVPVQFRASATLSGCTGQPEYYWFPDANSTATIREQNPIVTYDQPGTYIWEMDVETSDGVGCSKTGTITVTSGGGGGPGVPGAPGVTNGWIPVVIRGTGTNGAVWISDVSILNTGSGSTTVTVTIQTSSGPVTRTFTLPPWGQKLIQDIVNWLIPGGNATGPVNITSTQPVVVSTRVYNRFGSTAACLPNGTLGQSLGIWTIQNALANGKTALLTGLIQTSSYRTNIGLTNLSNASAVVQVELYDEHGNRVAVRSINLDPHQWTQANKPFLNWAGLSNVHGGSAVITVTSGSGVVAYGSVIDNITNDPTTIHMLKFQ
ncbi:MAG TPA: hypothetical protein ENK19_07920 [Acidobacteria bacterium]|nr:hypothetical protein [Acidobacteriota bacterium]